MCYKVVHAVAINILAKLCNDYHLLQMDSSVTHLLLLLSVSQSLGKFFSYTNVKVVHSYIYTLEVVTQFQLLQVRVFLL